MERFVKERAGARQLDRPSGRRRRRWTDDHLAGALGSVLNAHARFDLSVEDGPPSLPLSRSGHG